MKESTSNFKVGDKVRRIHGWFLRMKPGDIGTVTSVDETRISLKEYTNEDGNGNHNAKNLELANRITDFEF